MRQHPAKRARVDADDNGKKELKYMPGFGYDADDGIEGEVKEKEGGGEG
jgi:hypothetical protein